MHSNRSPNPQGQPLGGTVDLEFQPRVAAKPVIVKGADASKEIDVSGLERGRLGIYQLTVTPTDIVKPVTRIVTIPATGVASLTIVIDKTPVKTSGTQTLKGALVFDYGLPGANLPLRLYSIGFAGQDTRLGEAQSNAQGAYSLSYAVSTPSANGAAPSANLQVRVLDAAGKEIPVSATKYNAG